MFDATIKDWICTLTHSELRTARSLLQGYIEIEKLVASSGTEERKRALQ